MKHIENPALIKSANDYKDDYFILLSANGDENTNDANIGTLLIVLMRVI